jgi:hypothetical protein
VAESNTLIARNPRCSGKRSDIILAWTKNSNYPTDYRPTLNRRKINSRQRKPHAARGGARITAGRFAREIHGGLGSVRFDLCYIPCCVARAIQSSQEGTEGLI